MLWLLASDHENPKSGFIDGPESKVAFRLRLSEDEFSAAINPLIDKGFIILASTPLAECLQHATTETEDRVTEIRVRDTKSGLTNGREHYAAKKPTGASEGKRIAEKILRGEALGAS